VGVEQKPKSLDELQTHFAELYGARNNIWLSNRLDRIVFLNMGVKSLQDAVRKNGDDNVSREILETMMARVSSRIFCVAHGVNNTSISKGLIEKYGKGCGYCGNIPCKCMERRSVFIPNKVITPEQQNWGLSDWQLHLNSLYGNKNKAKGVYAATDHLSQEVVELFHLEYVLVPKMGVKRWDIEHEYSKELADCMAWTIAVASIIGIGLDIATKGRFWPLCWNCQQKPCICGKFNMEQVNA